MFNAIAGNYDFLNHFLSLGIDKLWRKKAINTLLNHKPKKILDLACGTGDLSIACLKLNPDKVIGIDISEKMIEIGKKKIRQKKHEDSIDLIVADSENLPFNDNSFEAVTVAFGVRNFENLHNGLSEAYRVLKPGGNMVILEFSKPGKFPVKQLYFFYFSKILPWIGRLFSRDGSAYNYLPDSVKEFPQGNEFLKLMDENGFKNLNLKKLSFGICSIYYGQK